MQTPPDDLDDRQVSAAVAAGWRLRPQSIRYEPVGFGSHHWSLIDSAGVPWFVTADEVDSPGVLDDLDAALRTAVALRERAGLGFVGAPVAAPNGSLIQRTGRYAITLHPQLVAADGGSRRAVAAVVADLVAAVHNATPEVAGVARPDHGSLPGRSAVQQPLTGARTAATLGPYADAFRELIIGNRSVLTDAFAEYDDTSRTLAADPDSWVITHGEPKADNIMITGPGPVLIDWETARLAPPERDLWLIGDHDRYAELTGNRPRPDRLRFYRLRWDLADLCCFGDWFCRAHRANPDTELGWAASVAICQRLADGTPGPPWASA